MWARFTVLNETPIASAIAGCVIPLSRSNTIWMRSRCAAGIFHRSAVFSSRICFLVHLTIRPPESDSQSESYPAPSRDPEKRQKSLDSNSYGSGISRHFADGSSGLLPDLCSRGVRPSRSLRDGAGGFLPGVPLGCLDMLWRGSNLGPGPLDGQSSKRTGGTNVRRRREPHAR